MGTVADFPRNAFRRFTLDGRPVGVVRTDGGFYAVRDRCPHQGADICAGRVSGTMLPSAPHEYAYDADTPVVVCPWHRWEFDMRTGASVGQVSRKRLVVYEVEIEDGDVYVNLRPRRQR